MRKILITGASGFIGRHLIDYLIEDKVKPRQLRLMVSPRSDRQSLSDRGLDVLVGDIRNKKDVKKAVQGVRVLYHLASKTGEGVKSYKDLKETNIDGTRNLVEQSIKSGVKKFVFFSSVAVYGLSTTVGDIKNYEESHEKSYSEGYGRTKYEAEKVIQETAQKTDLKYIIIRPTHVYGPGSNGGLSRLIKAVKGRYFFYIGDGKNIIDYVYVKDVVRIARELEKSKVVNEDFIISPLNHLTQEKVINFIAKEIGVKTPQIHVHKYFALFVSHIIKHFVSPDQVRALSSDFYFNARKLKRFGLKLNYPFDKGLSEYLQEERMCYKRK